MPYMQKLKIDHLGIIAPCQEYRSSATLHQVLVIEPEVREELHRLMTQYVRYIDMRGEPVVYQLRVHFDNTSLYIERIEADVQVDHAEALEGVAKKWAGKRVMILNRSPLSYAPVRLDSGKWLWSTIWCYGPLPIGGVIRIADPTDPAPADWWSQESGSVLLL